MPILISVHVLLPCSLVPPTAVLLTTLRLQDGHTEVVELLLSKGADVDSRLDTGQTALLLASEKGQIATVEVLLRHGADMHGNNNEGFSALLLASYHGHTTIVRMLLDAGADIHFRVGSGHSALHVAAQNGYTETVELLLGRGADVQATSETGHTALMVAAQSGATSTVEMLVDVGADVDAELGEGHTALMFSTQAGRIETVAMLLGKGANIDAKLSNGATALMFAVETANVQMVELLLGAGANIYVVAKDGNTALAHAQANKLSEIETLLHKAKAAEEPGYPLPTTPYPSPLPTTHRIPSPAAPGVSWCRFFASIGNLFGQFSSRPKPSAATTRAKPESALKTQLESELAQAEAAFVAGKAALSAAEAEAEAAGISADAPDENAAAIEDVGTPARLVDAVRGYGQWGWRASSVATGNGAPPEKERRKERKKAEKAGTPAATPGNKCDSTALKLWHARAGACVAECPDDTSSDDEDICWQLEDSPMTKWLEERRLKKFARLFFDEAITFGVLVQMSDEELKGIGVKKFGERKKLRKGIASRVRQTDRDEL